jgi:D-Tyr-tRNA(Tyr) deacylase/Oxidoreductase family, NAD-binding Rossmann fold
MTAARAGERRLRLGIVGVGRATETLHLPALATVPSIEVAALADADAGTLARVASRFRIARTSIDPAELVADRSLDAIAVCVPAHAHAPIALAVLDAGVMNRSIVDVDGDLLAVSQFTLFASTRKGNRPSWHGAAPPEVARPAFDAFVALLARERGRPVATGEFGADMLVALVNDGPVTILLDSRARE